MKNDTSNITISKIEYHNLLAKITELDAKNQWLMEQLKLSKKRSGINLSRQTMSNWLITATENWLLPIYEKLKEKLLSCDVLHADETTLQVLREPGKTAQSKSYMWLYRTSGDADNPADDLRPIVLYEYQPSRSRKHPEAFLKYFKGYLHTDGYEAYHGLHENITVVGCSVSRTRHCSLRGESSMRV